MSEAYKGFGIECTDAIGLSVAVLGITGDQDNVSVVTHALDLFKGSFGYRALCVGLPNRTLAAMQPRRAHLALADVAFVVYCDYKQAGFRDAVNPMGCGTAIEGWVVLCIILSLGRCWYAAFAVLTFAFGWEQSRGSRSKCAVMVR